MKGEVKARDLKMPKAKIKTKGASASALAAAAAPAPGPPSSAAATAASDAALPVMATAASNAAATASDAALPVTAEAASARHIIPDAEAYLYIKQASRESYKNAWEAFRASCPAQEEFERRTPKEKELLDYFVGLREGRVLEDGEREDRKAGTTICTTYSLLNGVMKHKYSFSMKAYPRISARMKVWISEDVKKKAAIFTPAELKQFCEAEDLEGGYWEVRKAVVVLAYFGGLRLVEAQGLQVEKISPCSEGFDVVHDRAKGRTDKPSTKFTVPKKKVPKEGDKESVEDSFDWAACLGKYLARIKEELGKYQGRVFYTGRKNGSLVNQPMGRNMLAEVPHQVARFLGKPNVEDYTFHSFRRSSATAAADAGATPQQMVDFFGWKHPNMTAEYISTSRHQLSTMASRLGSVGQEAGDKEAEGAKVKQEKRKKKKRKRKRESSSSSSSSSSSNSSIPSVEEEKRKKVTKKGKREKKVVIINM